MNLILINTFYDVALYFATICRIIYFNIYADKLKYIVKTINESFKYETDLKLFDDNMENFLKGGKIFSMYWLMQGLLSAIITTISPVFSDERYSNNPGSDFVKVVFMYFV